MTDHYYDQEDAIHNTESDIEALGQTLNTIAQHRETAHNAHVHAIKLLKRLMKFAEKRGDDRMKSDVEGIAEMINHISEVVTLTTNTTQAAAHLVSVLRQERDEAQGELGDIIEALDKVDTDNDRVYQLAASIRSTERQYIESEISEAINDKHHELLEEVWEREGEQVSEKLRELLSPLEKDWDIVTKSIDKLLGETHMSNEEEFALAQFVAAVRAEKELRGR